VSAAGAGSSESGAPAAGSGETSEGIDAPSMTISGCAATHDSVARFVAALRDIDGVTRVGLESSEKSTEDAAASGGAPAPSGASTADSSGSCVDATTFKLIVAFDGVEVDPTSGVVVPTEPPAAAADEAGIADAKAEQTSAKESAGDAVKKSNEAIDRYVPGA
jgi:hypothetical protein